ncbi:MAG: SDR family oxidoreductase [Oscillospiraceae bacterium]|nr:SDR family oxidoreductase [Oscillospiraceae bacterium]
MDAFRMDGKVALVAGASSGMGAGTAKILAEAGAKVFILARRESKLAKVQKEITDNGGICEYMVCDTSSEENCKNAVDACVKAFGRLDALVYCAGIEGSSTLYSPVEEQFEADNLHNVMGVNFDGIYYMIKYVYPEMVKVGGGSIVDISSVAAIRSGMSSVAYASSKGAMWSMVKTLARMVGPQKIRVNSILPGMVETEMTQDYVKDPAFLEQFIPTIALRDSGKVDDIGNTVLFLVSDASRYITGQDIVVDGGMTC